MVTRATTCSNLPARSNFYPSIALLVFFAMLIWGNSVLAIGVTYQEGASRSELFPGRPDLSVLTWQLPNGVLVLDRLGNRGENRFGDSFRPQFESSEWFLVQGKGAHSVSLAQAARIRELGTVHLVDAGAFVVEIPTANLAAFDRLVVDRARLPLSPPPAGWDRAPGQPRTDRVGLKRDEAQVQQFVDQISEASFFQVLKEISGHVGFVHDGNFHNVSSRYYNTADKDIVADYLGSKLEDFGYTVEFDWFTYNGWACRNIVATKLGTISPGEFVIVGGHYDSTSPQPSSQAPGAEDNGSGTSLVLELARLSANRDFERSVQFVLFDSEEQGLNGSFHFVQEAVVAGRDIVAAITADMVCWYDQHYGVRIEGEHSWEWLMSIMEDNVIAFTEISKRKDYNSWGSDHVPFQQAGIPAFLAIDWDWSSYPYYHTTNDSWVQVSQSAHIGYQIARGCAATLADVAYLLPPTTAVNERIPTPVEWIDAHPNPFNPRVTISFGLKEPSHGELAIFDLSGRRLTVLADGLLPAGEHSVSWAGQDSAGRSLSSGTYFCRLKTGDSTSSVKLNLVR